MTSVAILTGDLIGSTQAPAGRVEAAMRTLADAAGAIADDTRFTRFRGDGWQVHLADPGACLWACLFLVARLRAADTGLATRISVGIGPVSHLGDSGLGAAIGPALTVSGRGLDRMEGPALLAIDGNEVDRFQKRVFDFAADRAARWSREQAEAMALALDGDHLTHAEIATRLGISRQAVEARLAAAGYRLLNAASLDFLDRYGGGTPSHD